MGSSVRSSIAGA